MSRCQLGAALLSVGLVAGCETTPPKPPAPLKAGPELLETYVIESDPRLIIELNDTILRWTQANDDLKGRLEEILKKMALANRSALRRLLSNGDARSQAVSAGALGFGGDSHDVDVLITALQSFQQSVVENALLSLWLIASPATPLAPLVAALSSENPRVRSNAALALGAILAPGDTSEALQPLIFALQDTDDITRANAAGTLGRIGNREATPHLVRALSDKYPLIRLRAAVSLGAIRDPSAVPALAVALDDEGEKVRIAAYKALVEITGQSLPRERKDWEEWAASHAPPPPTKEPPSTGNP